MTPEELTDQAWEYRRLWSELTNASDGLVRDGLKDGLWRLHEVRDRVYCKMLALEEEAQDAGHD